MSGDEDTRSNTGSAHGGGGGHNGGTHQHHHGGDDEDHFVARCRGLPWSTTQNEIKEFFKDARLKDDSLDSIHVTLTKEGRPSGEAYIELETQEDLDKAVAMDRKHMGKRYVEVFKSKKSEMSWVLSHFKFNSEESSGSPSAPNGSSDHVVRLRGLPFDCTPDDIVKFFQGLDVNFDGILMTTDYQGRSSGEAYVRFRSRDQAEQALERNKQSIGHRYIEIFRSSNSEASRAALMGGNGGGGFGGAGAHGSGAPGGGRMGGRYSRGGGGMGGSPSRGGRPTPYDRSSSSYSMGRGYGGGSMGGGGSRGGPDRGYGGGAGGGYGNYEGYFSGYSGGYDRVPSQPPRSYDRGGPQRSNFVVKMRGLPFRVTENDIGEWFSSVADPVDIELKFNSQGRPSGEADVYFACDSDAKRAMTKDRQNMQHRYVELFYNNPVGGFASGFSQY